MVAGRPDHHRAQILADDPFCPMGWAARCENRRATGLLNPFICRAGLPRRFYMAVKLQQVSDCLPALFGDRPLVVRAAVVDVRESSGLLKYSSDTQRQ